MIEAVLKVAMPKYHGYSITLQLTHKELHQFCLDESDKMEPLFFIVGFEYSPTTGKPHGQMYAWFRMPITFFAAKRMFAPHHVEVARLSPVDNFLYCTKEHRYYVRGNLEEVSNHFEAVLAENIANEKFAEIMDETLDRFQSVD